MLPKFTIARVLIDQMINFNGFHLQFIRGMSIVYTEAEKSFSDRSANDVQTVKSLLKEARNTFS
ncbi:hypothetical protein PL11201_570008 [Planktothrix sp. PCC 11201]|nr:hypothetical protein PL11201_570008 [Planktothrix sp. PCC 11201]